MSPTPGMAQRMTRGHFAPGRPAPYFVAPAFDASGGLKSTADDMLKFIAGNLSGGSTVLHRAMRESQRPQRPIGDSGEHMGTGWATGTLTGAPIVGFAGGTHGYASYVAIDLARRRGVVVLVNVRGGAAQRLGLHLLDPAGMPPPARAGG